MASDYARRGRPRGSGLDDRDQLCRIAELLDADPALKPTTAIKSIGVTDPSSIRRLRDKLKSLPGSAADASLALGRAEPESVPAPQLARARADLETDAAAASSTAASLASATGSESRSSDEAWLARWCALGLSAMSSTMEAQMALMHDLLTVPQVESALRQQLMFNEVAKAFCPKRPDIRSTLH